ncbi:MAG: hypothetical protein GY754_17510 [bacterium]|nr:hypothetical protein [bacterium]
MTEPDNKKDTLDELNELFEKTGLVSEVSRSHMRAIRKNKRKSYLNLLKQAGEYTIWEGITSYVYFGFTRFGFQLSTLQSSIIIIAASVTAAAAISVGGYLVVSNFISNTPVEKTVLPVENVPAAPANTGSPETVKIKPKFTLNLEIGGVNIDKKIIPGIVKKIDLYFKNNNLSIDKKYFLSGEIIFDEGVFAVKMTAFDYNSEEKIFLKNKELNNANELYPFFLNMSKKIAEQVR